MQILLILLTLFIAVPLVELTLLLMLADKTHWGFAIGLVVLTGVAGTALARTQGVRVLAQIRERFAAGEVPGDALMDGVMIFVAGALLITPGMLTDAFGFSLLIPACRRAYRGFLVHRLKARFHVDQISSAAGGVGSGFPWTTGQGGQDGGLDGEREPRESPGGTTIDSYVVRSSDDADPEETRSDPGENAADLK